MVARLADEEKWPRKWWWPEAKKLQPDGGNKFQRQHDEVSLTLRRTILALIGFTFFAWLTLGAPDVKLLAGDAEIDVPFAGTEVSYTAFLIIGPFVLIVLAIYLHIFFDRWLWLGGDTSADTLPFFFNMGGPLTRGLTVAVVYWMVPLMLFGFVWKALPRPEAPFLMLIAASFSAGLAWLYTRRKSDKPRYKFQFSWLAFVLMVFLAGDAISVAAFTTASIARRAGFDRTLQLANAKLMGQDLRSIDLHAADLTDADLTKADLRGANLTAATLRRAQLQGANLYGAQLQGADLGEAQLQGADLHRAELQGANLVWAELQGANLAFAELQGANLEGAQLQGVNLVGVKLQGANLAFAELQGANLEGAQLQGAGLAWAQLQGANLEGAQLQGADLKLAQLQGADLRDALLGGSDLRPVLLDLSLSDLRDVNFDPLEGKEWDELGALIRETVPEGDKQKEALERLEEGEERGDRFDELDLEHADRAIYEQEAFDDWPEPPDEKHYDSDLAPELTRFACGDEHIARGIARRVIKWHDVEQRDLYPLVAEKLLDEKCPVVQQLPEEVRTELQEIAKRTKTVLQ